MTIVTIYTLMFQQCKMKYNHSIIKIYLKLTCLFYEYLMPSKINVLHIFKPLKFDVPIKMHVM